MGEKKECAKCVGIDIDRLKRDAVIGRELERNLQEKQLEMLVTKGQFLMQCMEHLSDEDHIKAQKKLADIVDQL